MRNSEEMPEFHPERIHECYRQRMLYTVHFAAAKFLEQPGMAEKFEKWKAEKARRRKEEAACS